MPKNIAFLYNSKKKYALTKFTITLRNVKFWSKPNKVCPNKFWHKL